MGEKITNEAVISATGKNWTDWYAEIEGSTVKADGPVQLTSWLTEKHPNIGGWWSQVITRRWDAERSALSVAD